MAVGESMSVAPVASGWMAGPLYWYRNSAAFPPADELSAMPVAMAAVYCPTLPLSDHWPVPVGSQTMPSRGLSALSFATASPWPLAPWFLSHRRPRLKVTRLFQCQLSLKKTECVLKFDPRLPTRIGWYWITVDGPGSHCG